MEAKAIAKSISMSARKVRLVVDQIRGRSVNEAYAILQYSKKVAADPVSKTLRSAVANAQYKAQEDGDVRTHTDSAWESSRTGSLVGMPSVISPASSRRTRRSESTFTVG